MKKLLIFLTLVFAGLSVGCEEGQRNPFVIGNGMVDTRAERERCIYIIENPMQRQFVDDSDYFWLLDRNMRLTEWHPRTD